MGRTGGEPSLPALIQEVASGDYDAILHVGDFAYDLDSDGGVVSAHGYVLITVHGIDEAKAKVYIHV